MRRWPILLGLVTVMGVLLLLAIHVAGVGSAVPIGSVSGIVVGEQGPLSGARVRWRATEFNTTTDPDGRFTLSNLPEGQPIEIAAWAAGYYISSTLVSPPAANITMTLRAYHTSDHPEYDWISPEAGTSDSACGNCHPMILQQWQDNAHGTAINNDRFYSLYNGTNLAGNQLVGPGFLQDFPNSAGLCANCHAPGKAIDSYLTTNMNGVRDQLEAGVHCDYCHKVGGIYLDPASGSVYANTPGAQSQKMLRPPEGEQIFFGPYDDIKNPDTYLPLISDSAFCAPCHQFSFWGTPIYESYNEWLASPYASQGVTCQDCHMLPNGDTHFALPEKGGLPHPPDSIPSHLQLGANDPPLLAESLDLQVRAFQEPGQVRVIATVTNSGAGHHWPTDFPGRQLLLVIKVVDSQGQPLSQLEGSTIPSWGGPQAYEAGKIFAKILMDVESGDYPVVSYWKQSLVRSDNRLPALASDRSRYLFQLPADQEPATVSVNLLFRRVFQDMADAKEWDTPDILLDQVTVQPWQQFYIPMIYQTPD